MNVLIYIGVSLLVVALLYATVVKIQDESANPLENDFSNDYTRWNPADIAIAGYIGIFADDKVRLDKYFQALIYAVLKRSNRAVDEKIRRISTVGSDNSDASVADKDIAFILANYDADQAKVNFLNDLYTAGASKKQVQEIEIYL